MSMGHTGGQTGTSVLQPLGSPVAFSNAPVLLERSAWEEANLLHTWTHLNDFFFL